MYQNDSADINILLAKHFSNEPLSPFETEQFFKWQQEHQQKYTHLKKLIHKMSKKNMPMVEKTDKAWKNILKITTKIH